MTENVVTAIRSFRYILHLEHRVLKIVDSRAILLLT
jgi:hypothetical protein